MDKALVIKYLDNNCTPEEAAIVEAWLQLPESSAVLSALLDERMEQDIAESMAYQAADEQRQRWHAAMRTRMGRDGMIRPVRKWYYMVAAASILLVAGFFGVYQHSRPKAVIVAMTALENKAGERRNITLSDGTVIYLGAASKVSYPEHFEGDTREIILTGEAFFDVATDTKHPFIIHTGSVATTVLGTSFKIAAFEGQPITVAVATGKVRVTDKNKGQELAVLTAGKQLRCDAHQVMLADVHAEDIAAWHKGRLVFNNQTLGEIATTLERWYDVKINFSRPQTAGEKVTITLFAAAGLNTTLQTLAVGNNFTYSMKGREIIIH